ncbi:hypothetical protein [Rhizobacter sp. Root404]|uniref:hypothetical protein n=1 Tax=Rhizobacter sp. Root404 TaxID=1736528 RepID=UPI0006FF19C5|nr:hypothetical protein [Rhizobacter sp. Root404]KQW36658.1 hypothetical protein ASC76_18610 [Rhizobacter sp. Root404]
MNRTYPPRTTSSPDAWQSTRAQTSLATQIMGEDDVAEQHDIGRPTGNDQRELFVSCPPEQAMQQQFEHLRPEFIAVHDIATASSQKLLAGMAAASGRALQHLMIRRQGNGTTLANLVFVELPTADGRVLRMYSTEVDADMASRHALARMLLAYSRLGVLMVGSLPGHAVTTALKPFHEHMLSGPWPNRQLLLLPLASGCTLISQGMELARDTGVGVRATPQVGRPADAWGFISAAWSRMMETPPRAGERPMPALAVAMPSMTAEAPATMPATPVPVVERRGPDRLQMRPMPPVPTAATRAITPQNPIERYVRQVSELPGMASCCVFDVATGADIAHAGASPGAADLALHGKTLLAGMSASSRSMGLGHVLPEAAITLGSHHLLLRGLPGHPGLALHAALDKMQANLTLVRLQVQRLDALLVPPPGA